MWERERGERESGCGREREWEREWVGVGERGRERVGVGESVGERKRGIE